VDRKGKSCQAVDRRAVVLYISTIPEIATFETPVSLFIPSVRLAGACRALPADISPFQALRAKGGESRGMRRVARRLALPGSR
jgi:hypothetical protein